MASRKWVPTRSNPDFARKEELENLFIFGYQCKIFRDDERAKYVDRGKHLIPWMGEQTLLIDRYDGRGHLHDLRNYDAEKMSRDCQEISEEEQRIEALCDEERYLELHTDMDEKAMYEEEELKRLNEALADDNNYAAVAFNYSGSAADANAQQAQGEEEEEEDEAYEADPELQVPKNMPAPDTMKLYAIIEKTALFISKHGAQMEIMIKTKQKDNPQFSFLNYEHELNPFYRHVVKMLKNGRYKPRPSDSDSGQMQDGYLHPSLAKNFKQEVIKEQTREEFLMSLHSKLPAGQIANTPYAILLSNLSKHTGRNSPQPASTGTRPTTPVRGSPDQTSTAANEEDEAVDTSGPMHRRLPPVPGTEPVHLPSAHDQPPPPGTEPSEPLPRVRSEPVLTGGRKRSKGLAVEGPSIVPPPPDLLPIVDKMAAYVAKNGPEFELIVRKKKDKRFEFIEPYHMYHPYYEHKKREFQAEIPEENREEPETMRENAVEHPESRELIEDKDDGRNKSISFSLKPKDGEGMSLGSRTALLYESSEEEDETGEKRTTTTDPQVPEAPMLGHPTEYYCLQPGEPSSTAASAAVSSTVAPDNRPQELPAKFLPLSAEAQEKLERKQAEEKLRDRLASAARDKLAQAAREKQLKAERKRKAAMFINLLKTSAPAAGPNPPVASQVTEEAVYSEESSFPENSGYAAPHPYDNGAPPAEGDSPYGASGAPPTYRRSESPLPCRTRLSRDSSPASKTSAKPTLPRSLHLNIPALIDKVRVRSRSRSRSPSSKGRRSRSPHKRKKHSRRRSPTPPAAYFVARPPSPRPRPRVSRSRTPTRYKGSQTARPHDDKKAGTRSRDRPERLRSPTRKRSRSRDRVRKSRERSLKKSRRRSRSASRERSKVSKKSSSKSKKSRKDQESSRRKSKKSSSKRTSSKRSPSRRSPSKRSPSKPSPSKRSPSPSSASSSPALSPARGSRAMFTVGPDETASPSVKKEPQSDKSSDGSSSPESAANKQCNNGLPQSGEHTTSETLLTKVRAILKASRAVIRTEEDDGLYE